MSPDHELLRQYAETGSEAAFAEVVRRQVNFVYSTARRLTAGNSHLAEEITQTVFTDLARKAGKLSGHTALAGWLHRATRFAAVNAIRSEQRRRVREQEAVAMNTEIMTSETPWGQLSPLLDDAVDQLEGDDREAVLLRFFHGKSHREIGTVLGLSENSANKKVERALEKLRLHFGRKGVTVTSLALGTAIGANSVQAAPAGLAAKMTGLALAGVGGGTIGQAALLALFMNTHTKIIVAGVVALAIGATLILNWPAVTEPAVIAASGPSSTPAEPGGSKAPRREVQVAEPAAPVPAVIVPTPPATDQFSPEVRTDNFVAGAKPDLNDAIATGIYFLETKDMLNLVKTLGSQAMQQGLMKSFQATNSGLSKESVLAQMRVESPEVDALLEQQLEVFRAIQNMAPETSADGTRVRYRFDQPVAGVIEVVFSKVGPNWYYNANGIPASWFNAGPRAGGAGGGSNFGAK